jgi:hypothetical protein
MGTATPTRRPTTVVGAAAVLLVKAALGLWGAYALISASSHHYRRFLGGVIHSRHLFLGVLILVLAVLALVVATGLLAFRTWARIGAFVLEGVAVILALSRVGTRPGAAIVSLALSAVVIGLLLTPSAARTFQGAKTRTQ